jgi:hypothetical protein
MPLRVALSAATATNSSACPWGSGRPCSAASGSSRSSLALDQLEALDRVAFGVDLLLQLFAGGGWSAPSGFGGGEGVEVVADHLVLPAGVGDGLLALVRHGASGGLLLGGHGLSRR